jgi:hypothetical protein
MNKYWLWIIEVLKEERTKQKYSKDMFPQISEEISKSINALTDVIQSCEFRANQNAQIITPFPQED